MHAITMTTMTICLLLLVSIGIIHGFRTSISLPTTAAPPRSSTFLRLAKRNNSNDDVVVAATKSDQRNLLSRRQIGELSFAAVGLTTSYLGTRENTPQDYGLWGVLPVGPYKRKKTIMETIVPDTIWTFDQKVCVIFFSFRFDWERNNIYLVVIPQMYRFKHLGNYMLTMLSTILLTPK